MTITETQLPYNRSLHPDDYNHLLLATPLKVVQDFERNRCAGRFFYRKDHKHREWEYANVLRQIVDLYPPSLYPPEQVRILDTGFGINYFTLALKMFGYDVTASDSEDYGKVTEVFQQQCEYLGLQIPLIIAPVQRLWDVKPDIFDVTLCISVIEHLHPDDFEAGFKELVRVTKPGGYVMVTSDFFRDEAHALASPSLACQHSRFYEKLALYKITQVLGHDVAFVGGSDTLPETLAGLQYRGDFVNGHGFVNFCLQKRLD